MTQQFNVRHVQIETSSHNATRAAYARVCHNLRVSKTTVSQWSRTRRRWWNCALQWDTIQGDCGPEPEELRAEQLFQLSGQRHPLSFPETHEFSACEGCTSTPSVLETQAAILMSAASGQLNAGSVRIHAGSSCTDVKLRWGCSCRSGG